MGDEVIIFTDQRGRLARATRLWSEAIKARANLPDATPVMVELAIDAASLADAARAEGDGRLYLSAANRLTTLMATVERLAVSRDDGGSGDDWSAELADLLGSAPTVGNPEDG